MKLIVILALFFFQAEVGLANPKIASIYEAGDKRDASSKDLLQGFKSSDLNTLVASIVVGGRIGDPALISPLAAQLNHPKPSVRIAAAHALGLIPHPRSLEALKKRLLVESDHQSIGMILQSLAQAGDDTSSITSYLDFKVGSVRSAAAKALALAWTWNRDKTKLPDKKIGLLLLGLIEKQNDIYATYALTRAKNLQELGLASELQRVFSSKVGMQPALAALIMKAYAKSSETVDLEFVKPYITSPHAALAIEASRAAGLNSEFAPAPKEVVALLSSAKPAIAVAILNALKGDHKKTAAGKSWSQTMKDMVPKASPWVGQEMVKAWARVDGQGFKKFSQPILRGKNLPLKTAAIRSLATLNTKAEADQLAAYLQHEEKEIVIAALEGVIALESKSLSNDLIQQLSKVDLRSDSAIIYNLAEIAKSHKLASLANYVASHYSKMQGPELVEARMAVLEMIHSMGMKGQSKVVSAGLADPVDVVRKAALGPNSKKTPKPSTPTNLIAYSKTQVAVGRRYQVNTTKGSFTLELLDEAPFTAFHFAKLADDGFYNKKTFHRVVPNFVVQGGDPRGDGFGGPGYMIREEISQLSHMPGTVGIATAGKDTGGSQFFVNLAPNIHLDGHYTIFARVISGMESVMALEQGDSMLSVKQVKAAH